MEFVTQFVRNNVRTRCGGGKNPECGSGCSQLFQSASKQYTRLLFPLGREAWNCTPGLVNAVANSDDEMQIRI
jgi:hypothetical protein